MMRRNGFTITELLIIIGILAVLATATILVLNPVEYLKQSRDSNRLQDLQTLNKALNLYIANDGQSFRLPGAPNDAVYVSIPSANPDCAGLGMPDNKADDPLNSIDYRCVTSENSKNIDGTGWVPVNFESLSAQVPITKLPIDPLNSVSEGYYYTYVVGSWALTAKTESAAFSAGGSKDVASTDGGGGDARYEIGTDLTLTPPIIVGGDGGGSPSIVANPTFSPAEGTYSGTQSVTITTSTAGASIRYTTDGTTPTSTVGTIYSGAVSINATTTLKAIAYKTGMSDSNVTSGLYTITAVGKYWVQAASGCDGNWSDIDCWSLAPGGTGGEPVPTSSDDVYFNASSFTATGQTMTIDIAANAKNFNWTGVTNNPTWAGSATLDVAGSFTLVSAMTRTYTGQITFSSATAGQTIGLDTPESGTVTLASNLVFNNTSYTAGGADTWTLGNDLTTGGVNSIKLNQGALNTNSKNVTTGFFHSNTTTARKLTLGSSQVTILGSGTSYPCPWQISSGPACNGTSSGIVLSSGTSTINFSGTSNTTAAFGNLTGTNAYYNVNSTGPNFSIFDANTFNGTVNITGSGRTYLSTNNTYNNFTRIGTALRGDGIMMNNTQTITGTLTLKGNGGASGSSPNRLIIHTNQAGQTKTMTVNAGGSVILSNVDFKDIGTSGTGWSTITASDVGNFIDSNGTSITSDASPARTLYWVGNGGNWSDSAHWSTASGVMPGNQTPPRPQDTIIFDSNSITSASQTITIDMARPGKNIDFSKVNTAYNPNLSFNTTATIIDNFTLRSGMTMSANSPSLTFYSRGMANLINAGVQWKNPIIVEAVSVTGGGVLMKDNFNSTNSISLIQGVLDSSDSGANHNMTMSSFLSTVGWVARTVTMGSGSANGGGTWTLTGSGTVWNTVHSGGTSAITINPGLSNIVITNNSNIGKTFSGNAGTSAAPVGRTYYNLEFTGGGTGALAFTGANTFNAITLGNGGTSPQTVIFPLGLTQVLNNTLSISGGVSPNRITIKSSSAIGTDATISAINTPTTLQYVDVIDIDASGATPFNCSSAGSCTATSVPANDWGGF